MRSAKDSLAGLKHYKECAAFVEQFERHHDNIRTSLGVICTSCDTLFSLRILSSVDASREIESINSAVYDISDQSEQVLDALHQFLGATENLR